LLQREQKTRGEGRGERGRGKDDSGNGGEREIAGKWKFREAGRRKNAARYCSIDTLLRRLLSFGILKQREREVKLGPYCLLGS